MRRPLPAPLDPRELGRSCDEPPPLLLGRGIEEFNAGAYYACHETLEELWRAEGRPIRRLYQGILLVGVSLYKVYEQANYVGAVSLLDRGLAHLEGFPTTCQGVDVDLLRRQSRVLRAELLRLGPTHVSQLARSFVPIIATVETARCSEAHP